METKQCNVCHADLPMSAYGIQQHDKGQKTPYYKATCRACLAKKKRQKNQKFSENEIMRREAPLRAAEQLLRSNPEVLALIVQRYREEYIPLLTDERQRMLIRREQRCAAGRAADAAKKKKAAEQLSLS